MMANGLGTLLEPARSRLAKRPLRLRRKLVFEIELSRLGALNARVPVVFRYGTADDVRSLNATDHEYDERAKEFSLNRLAQGDRMIIGEHQNRLVFYGWVMFSTMERGYCDLVPISSDRVYVYKCFTTEAARGKRVFHGFFAFLGSTLPERGFRRVVLFVASKNDSSLASVAKAGFRRIGSVVELRFLGRHLNWMPARLRRAVSSPVDRDHRDVDSPGAPTN